MTLYPNASQHTCHAPTARASGTAQAQAGTRTATDALQRLHDFRSALVGLAPTLPVIRCKLVSPVQQCLPNNRRDEGVFIRTRIALPHLATQLASPSTLGSSTSIPPFDLPGIISTTTAIIESTVPLKPTPRVSLMDPTFHFPEFLILTALDPVCVNFTVIAPTLVQGW